MGGCIFLLLIAVGLGKKEFFPTLLSQKYIWIFTFQLFSRHILTISNFVGSTLRYSNFQLKLTSQIFLRQPITLYNRLYYFFTQIFTCIITCIIMGEIFFLVGRKFFSRWGEIFFTLCKFNVNLSSIVIN